MKKKLPRKAPKELRTVLKALDRWHTASHRVRRGR